MSPTSFFLRMALVPSLAAVLLAQGAPVPAGARSVIVTVQARNGALVRGLTKDNFVVLVNGQRVGVLDASFSVAPRRIVILLNVGSHMAWENYKWQIACGAVDDLLSQAPSNVPIAMMTFVGGIRDIFDFAQGRPAIRKWIDQVSNREEPRSPYYPRVPNYREPEPFYDPVLTALRLLSPPQSGDAIYVITDSWNSGTSEPSTATALLESGTRLFGFLLVEPASSLRPDENLFRAMVQDSGGSASGIVGTHRGAAGTWDFDYAYDKRNREKVKAFSRELTVQLQAFWTLQLGAVPPSSKQSKFALEIVDASGKTKNKDLLLSYPHLLPAAR